VVNDLLRIHHIQARSRANGPGERCVIWVQGCSLGCPGCFNPETHPTRGGRSMSPESLVETVLRQSSALDGITISGGEPLQQPRPLVAFLRLFRQRSSLPVILFSGFTWDEVQAMLIRDELPALVDVLIAGRYVAEKTVGHDLVGSSNKTFHFLSERYSPQDFSAIPEAELFIRPDGTIVSSGISPFRFESPL
jgi:anaerobic ribonucleoside-triphosphate reductase activating protein